MSVAAWRRRDPTGGTGAAPYIAPALIILALVNLVPILWSIGISFFRFRADHPTIPPRFIGLGNYVDFVGDPDMWEHFVNTGTLIASSVTVQLIVGGLLAWLFYRPFPGRRLALMLVLAPMLLSMVVVGTFFNLFYDPTFGIVGFVMRALTGAPFTPLGSPRSAMISLVIADSWMWSPFVMLMLLAGLSGTPRYLFEAASIDRASGWQCFRTVVFPSIRGVLLLALLFRTIESFNMFDLIYTITNGGPGTSTETIATEIYDTAFVLFETGRASALGNLSLFAAIVLTNLYFHAVRRQERTQP